MFGQFFLGISIYQIPLFAFTLWTLPYLVRGFAFTPSKAGVLIPSTAGMAAVLSAAATPFLGSKLITRGRIDRIPLLAATMMTCAIPATGVAFLSDSLMATMVAASLAFFFVAGSYTLPQIVAQHLAPASMRAQFVAVYFLLSNIIGAGLGGVLTPYVATFFNGPAAIGPAVFAVTAGVTPIAMLLVLCSAKSFHMPGRQAR
ncbi:MULTISPECIES: hypothetical protein [Sphingobium]|uniref:hypothetical protein n=1 Tax=Sphingobium TaxID=165695 RepID=UPI002100C1F7|nr:hypothetical protein [Sphingobium sp. 15-1]